MKNLVKILFFSIISFYFISCGAASTGSRYEKENEKSKEIKNEEKTSEKIEEDFDITPYRTKIDIEESQKEEEIVPELWYGYDDSLIVSTDEKEVVETIPGYRVQVIATDNLEEANTIRSEIYFKMNKPDIYIDFEPPFYKVKVGDFKRLADANEMNFKLTQMGYTESRVISETINIFQ